MSKYLYRLFKTVVKEILLDLSDLGESGSELSYLIPDTRNFSKFTKLSDDKKHG